MAAVTRQRVAVSPGLLDLLPSFQRHLRAENKSPRTVESYSEAVRRLHDFLAARGMPTAVASITVEHVETFMEDQLARLRPSSARSRYASLRQFFRWTVEDGERTDSPMPRRPPKIPQLDVPLISEEHLSALMRSVESDKSKWGKRDTAILRVLIDTGCRLSELSGLTLDDVNLDAHTLTFHGKGGRVRHNAIGTKSVKALDRYYRIRPQHRDYLRPELWLGRSGPLTSYGVAEMVKRRAREAGIGNVHVHQFRHSVAHHLRLDGADDDATMRLMGWKDRTMLNRYSSSAGEQRAHAVHRRVGLGDRI